MMYQLPADISARIPSVMRATRSPAFQSASRPYGFSSTSVVAPGVFAPAVAAGAGVAEGAGAAPGGGASAGAAAGAGLVDGACAVAASGIAAIGNASIRAAARFARRFVFNM